MLKNAMNFKLKDAPLIDPRWAEFVAILEHHCALELDHAETTPPYLVKLQEEKKVGFKEMVDLWLDAVATLTSKMPTSEELAKMQAKHQHKT